MIFLDYVSLGWTTFGSPFCTYLFLDIRKFARVPKKKKILLEFSDVENLDAK